MRRVESGPFGQTPDSRKRGSSIPSAVLLPSHQFYRVLTKIMPFVSVCLSLIIHPPTIKNGSHTGDLFFKNRRSSVSGEDSSTGVFQDTTCMGGCHGGGFHCLIFFPFPDSRPPRFEEIKMLTFFLQIPPADAGYLHCPPRDVIYWGNHQG